MYGKTVYNRLSRFVREELPRTLIDEDAPRGARTGQRNSSYPRPVSNFAPQISREFNRTPDILSQKARSTPASFGVERLAPGTRVMHDIFNTGTVIAAKDMGGDVLYTVKFDSGEEKRLMATFAKLKKI